MTRLVVCQDSEVSVDSSSDVFYIEEELQSVSQEEWEEVYYKFGLFRPSGGDDIYESMWKHFSAPTLSITGGSLVRSVVLYRRLERQITETKPTEIICRSVDRPTDAATIDDLGSRYDIPVENAEYSVGSASKVAYLTAVLGLVPFLIDQLISLIMRPFVDLPEQVDTLFVPAVDRFESMRPVIDEAGMNYAVVATPMTIIWYLKSIGPEMRQYDPIPINQFTTPVVLLRQARYVAEIGIKEIFQGRLRTELTEFVSREFDATMPNAIELVLRQLHETSVYRRLFLGMLIENVIEELNIKQVAVGTESVLGRSILLAARRNDCTGYQIPHSVMTEHLFPIQLERTIFVPSKLPHKYLEEFVPPAARRNEEALVPAGRPYLTELKREADTSPVEESTDSFRLLVATQPHKDSVRDEFVSNTLVAARLIEENSDRDVRIVIKTHPSEDSGYYRSFFAESDQLITVTDENLRWNLQTSDLVLTVNSNVGLEAIVTGTPCVCLNFWSPTLYEPLYAKLGPFPVLRSPDEVRSFFSTLTTEHLSSLLSDQEQFVEENFLLDTDPARNIVSRMQSDLRERMHTN